MLRTTLVVPVRIANHVPLLRLGCGESALTDKVPDRVHIEPTFGFIARMHIKSPVVPATHALHSGLALHIFHAAMPHFYDMTVDRCVR